MSELVDKLRQAGVGTWLDSDLVGGQPWWDKILGQVRSCDAVLAVVSRSAVNSQACRFEREYAVRLGKPVLPVAIEQMAAGLLPQDIARLQVVDYSQASDGAAFKLASAIFALPQPLRLPDPLPPPPPVPPTRFGDLNDRIGAPSLSLQDQLGIIGMLEASLNPTSDQDDRQTALEMLDRMARRPDLYAQAAQKIQQLQSQARRGRPSSSWQWSPPPPPRPRPNPVPPPTAVISSRRGMAIAAAVLTFPTIFFCFIGIFALLSSNKVTPRLEAGDTQGAHQASSRVQLWFWVSIGLWVLAICTTVR